MISYCRIWYYLPVLLVDALNFFQISVVLSIDSDESSSYRKWFGSVNGKGRTTTVKILLS